MKPREAPARLERNPKNNNQTINLNFSGFEPKLLKKQSKSTKMSNIQSNLDEMFKLNDSITLDE